MSDLLPVLQSQAAPMSLCSICPKPGACCQKFALPDAGEFWMESWQEDALKVMTDWGVPFVPLSPAFRFRDEENGTEWCNVWFGCPKVTPEGLCSIYDDRPSTCSSFVPGSDKLCVFHPDYGTEGAGTREA